MSALAVTLTVDELAALVRREVKAAMLDRPTAAPPAVLTSEEAADFLKMPVGVLRKRVRKGEVPSFKIGSLLRFRAADLEAWLESLKTKKKEEHS